MNKILIMLLICILLFPIFSEFPPFHADGQPLPPFDVHIILGTVVYEDGKPADGARVTVVNQETSEMIYDTVGPTGSTGTSGWYQVDLSTLPQKYSEGDIITVQINGTGEYSGWTGEGTVIVDRTINVVQWVNVTVYQQIEWLPSTPRSLQASSGFTGGVYWISLQWEAPQDDGGSPLTSYLLYRGDTLEDTSLYHEAINRTRFNDTGVSGHATYYYRVSAVTNQGEGPTSSVVKASTRFPPHAHFTVYPSDPKLDESVLFVDQSTDQDGIIMNWTWNIGDDIVLYGKQVHYVFSDPGTYTIHLVATDNYGDQGTSSQTLTISSSGGTPGFGIPILLLALALLLLLRKKHLLS